MFRVNSAPALRPTGWREPPPPESQDLKTSSLQTRTCPATPLVVSSNAGKANGEKTMSNEQARDDSQSYS